MEMLDAALSYAERGWAVLPVHSVIDGSCTCRKRNCNSPGKHPIMSGGYKVATIDKNQIRAWWAEKPWANIGIATGGMSGLFVLDVDVSDGKRGLQSLAELASHIGALPKTYTVRTGSGGLHFYFDIRGKSIKSTAGNLGEGLDIRADGGLVIAPPSVHISGNRYTVERDYV